MAEKKELRELKEGEVYVYPPNSDQAVIKTLPNARDLVNGAGWTWRPHDPYHTPAALSPHQGLKAHEPGVEEILKGDSKAGQRLNPNQASPQPSGDSEAAGAASGPGSAGAEAESDADEAEPEAGAEAAPKKKPARSRSRSKSS